ncbi:hypothetical protein R5R35_008953 [Gryllus longicercus]|uniref:UDENN domain-containing protein n=1 Tax=Gryllus longicercus TaxID=2509291 RepID=A0AAN9VPD4_9ORTH
MMAYKPPPELRNRIESIKKKFEIVEPAKSHQSISNTKVSCTDIDKNLQSKCRNAAQLTLSSPLGMVKAICPENASFEKPKDKLKTCSQSGKGNIRRTPAFRCDKPCLSHQTSNPDKKMRTVVNTVKLFEDRHQCNVERSLSPEENVTKNGIFVGKKDESNAFKLPPKIVNVNCKSNVNENLLCNVKGLDNIDSVLKKLSSAGRTGIRERLRSDSKESRNVALNGSKKIQLMQQLDDSSTQRKENTLPQSEAKISKNGNKEKQNANEGVCSEHNSKLTFSLRAALKAPLPPGPPPKKPPRTFVHNSPDVRGKPVCTRLAPEKSKTDLTSYSKGLENRKKSLERSTTEPRIMLKKLENVLLKHQQGIGSVVITPRTGGTETTTERLKSPKGDEKREDFVKRATNNFAESELADASRYSKEDKQNPQYVEKLSSGCFDSLNCVSNIPKHLYEKLNEPQSEFFVESPLYPRKKISASSEIKIVSDQKRKTSASNAVSGEHIYAEPYACIDVEAILKAELSVQTKQEVAMHDTQVQNATEQNHSTLHYMCSPINPLDRMDALVNCNNVNTVGNSNNSSNSQVILCENKSKTNGSDNEFKSDEMHLPLKSFLHFNPVSKSHQSNSTNVPLHKLDRNKVQLFINQAFGSPLHDSPVASLDSASSDESAPTTPDEMNPPDIQNEAGGSRKTDDGKVTASCQQSDTLGENSLGRRQDLTKLTEERKVYVRRVSSRVFNTRQRLSSQPFSHLFHCIMLIGLNLDGDKKTKVPYIKSKYPVNASVPPLIEHLCFPDAADWPPRSSAENAYCDEQSYSLVITNEIGDHMFGYCRRVMPEGMDICLPLAYCILSPYRAKGFYFKILSELESQHGQPEWLQKTFIKQLYACEFPNPGQTLKLTNLLDNVPDSVEASLRSLANQLRRPLDSRLEEHDLTLLFSTLPVPILLQVFGSLLLERKVLFISNSLSKLSSCIEALHAILYPFSWHYTFIPVLPSAHIGVCEAPTPFIIGVLKDKVGKALTVSLEEGIIVDLDDPKIVQSVGDESTILPSRLKKCLKMALQFAENTTQKMEPARNVMISEAFIRMFVEICGHYANHVVTQQDGKKVFERESFIKAVPLHSVQLFLEWFSETAMFSSFVESRLNEGAETKGLFEQRALEHTEEMDKNTMLLHRNYKAINRKVKSFGDRLKDWAPFS